MEPKKVLIISEKYGAGHERAALAIYEGLKIVSPQTSVNIINLFEHFQPHLSEVSLKVYLRALNISPELWGYVYEKERDKTNITAAKRLLQLGASFILKEIIDEEKPDALVCTHPFPCCVVSRLKRKGLKIPILAAITDFDVHGFWVNDRIDAYIVANQALIKDLSKFGVPPSAVFPTGIPVDPRFDIPYDKRVMKGYLGFSQDRPLGLVAGGGFGMTSLDDDTLMDLGNIEAEFAILCGKNTAARKTLQSRVEGLSIRNIRALGFVENMWDFMKAADLIITKAGGLTLAEALAVKLPVVIYRPLPGQEGRNSRFLIRNGTAKRARDQKAMVRLARSLLEDPKKLVRLKDNADNIRKPCSARRAAQIILKAMEGGNWCSENVLHEMQKEDLC